MFTIKQSTARNLLIYMIDSVDHISGKTGLTLTITASKDGAAFATITPTVTERGNGWYSLALTTAHTDTVGELAFHITATGADPGVYKYNVEANTVGDVKTLSDAIKAKTDNLPAGIKKNTALSNFEILLVSSSDHITPVTGATVTATRSIDGGAFAACSNSVTEVSGGVYKIDLAASDLNGDVITLKFAATGADSRIITIVTNA